MLTVWCVCVGTKYGPDEVLLLRDMVARHLAQPFDFWCLSDRKIPGVDCLIPDDIGRYPGWWAKLLLFRYATAGMHLYLDIDTVVVGDLSPLLSEQFSASANWAQSGHGGIQSSVMAWGGDYSWIVDQFDPGELRADPHHPYGRYGATDYWGDQGFLTAVLGNPGSGKVKPMQGVASYKYHCRQMGRPPEWARAVSFHGEPKAAECSEGWIHCARSFTRAA